MVYVALFGWMMFLFFTCFFSHGKLNFTYHKNRYLVLFTVACILIMGMRNYTVGIDTATYMRYFNLVKNASWAEIVSGGTFHAMESAYCIIMKTCSIFSESYYFFQFIIAIIINTLMTLFIKKCSKNYFLASSIYLGLGLFTMGFNITRQMLAVSITANAWLAIRDEKPWKGLVLLLLAATIHISSLVFLIAYVIYIVKDHPKILRIIPIVAILAGLNYRRLMGFIRTHISTYYKFYSNVRKTNTMEAGFVRVLWLIIAFMSIYLIYKRQRTKYLIEASDNIYVNNLQGVEEYQTNEIMNAIFSLIYVIANFIGMYFNYFERIGLFFAPFVLLLFENFGMSIKVTSLRRFYYVTMWICFIIYFFLSVLRSEQYQYIPFYS